MNTRCPNIRTVRSGFTLIELSIVLVIMGLISAGVLVGRDLIKASEIRGQVSQIEKLNVGVTNFRLKYGCLPGDCTNAAELGFASTPAWAGNGDGIIFGSSTYPMHGVEPAHFWYALALASMIENGSTSYYGGPGVASPPTKLPGSSVGDEIYGTSKSGMWIAPQAEMRNLDFVAQHSWLMLGRSFNALSAPEMPAGVFNAAETYAIDIKIDDGLPESGVMQAATGIDDTNLLYRSTTESSGRADACTNDTAPNDMVPVYNVKITARTATSLCVGIVKASF